MSVIDLDAHRPHVLIDASTPDGEVYVYPLAYFEDFIAGGSIDLPDAVLRQIITDWLRGLRG